MQDRHKSACSMALVVAGLFGTGLYNIVVRFSGPSFLARDSVHGAWLGLCIGLEFVGVGGLAMLLKRKSSRMS